MQHRLPLLIVLFYCETVFRITVELVPKDSSRCYRSIKACDRRLFFFCAAHKNLLHSLVNNTSTNSSKIDDHDDPSTHSLKNSLMNSLRVKGLLGSYNGVKHSVDICLMKLAANCGDILSMFGRCFVYVSSTFC